MVGISLEESKDDAWVKMGTVSSRFCCRVSGLVESLLLLLSGVSKFSFSRKVRQNLLKLEAGSVLLRLLDILLLVVVLARTAVAAAGVDDIISAVDDEASLVHGRQQLSFSSSSSLLLLAAAVATDAGSTG